MSNRRSRSPLSISPAPFKPSHLSIPPSPFSPRTPLTTRYPFRNQTCQNNSVVYPQPAAIAPSSPLSWMWSCHQCHRSYRLGVTRRCLDDGHEFCSGTTTIKKWRSSKNPRRVKKHRACGSEFDYTGWKAWGRWRRGGARDNYLNPSNDPVDTIGSPQTPDQATKDCWNTCDYPSECRWGKKYGIHSPVETDFSTMEVGTVAPTVTAPAVDEISEGILKPENCKSLKKSADQEKTTFWGALLASAERRKSTDTGQHASSPLATVMEEADEEKEEEQGGEVKALNRDSDGDVLMETIDPAVLEKSNSSSLQKVQDISAPVNTFMSLISKRKYRRERRPVCPEPQSNKDHAYSVTVVTTPPPPAALKSEEKVRWIVPHMLLEELEPLSRVRSRGR